ncbi:MAG: LacI family DNA-binding transcriptional regulator, partial [Alphaproteobacteria bacterium]
VSRAFTPGASVSPRMREKVMRVAQELGYRPNVLARSLITGYSRIIGLVVGYLDNQYYPVALEKLSRALQARGYHVLVFMAAQTPTDFENVLEEILDYQVDGIVMASVAMSSDLTYRCAEAGVPVVLFNRSQDEGSFSAVTSDNQAGGRKLAEFLIAGGHERIGYIAGWEGASTQRDREAGFSGGLAAAGRDLYAREVGNYDFEKAKAATRRMFGAADRPDAVFVANDHMAIAAMDVMRYELDLKIPDDVSVVAYDDVPMAAWPSYDLTTVRQPTNRMVDAVVDALLAGIEDGDTRPRRVAFAGPLMVRGSARRPQGYGE